MKQGLIQVYTGAGKGKTTAATGLIVRALGHDRQVLLVRFLKPPEPVSGEIRFLRKNTDLVILDSGIGILGVAPEAEQVRRVVLETFQTCCQQVAENRFDLVVLDEINNCLHKGFLPLDGLLNWLDDKPATTEVVLTGRNAPEKLLARADLVTRMEAVKHPLAQGVPAREGIEY